MKNFGLKNLVLVEPKCKKNDKEALKRAKHAQDILKNAKIITKKDLKKFDTLIGTTAILGTDYNIPRSPLSAEKLAEVLKNKKKKKIGILFGREGHGLFNKEIGMCDFVVTIPTYKRYPTLNISHAAAISFYELFKKSSKKKSNSHINFASKKDKEIVLKLINNALDKMEFATKEKKETQRIVWKRIIGKSFLTKREAFALCGFFRKIK